MYVRGGMYMCPRHHVKPHVPSIHGGFCNSILGGHKVVLGATLLQLKIDVPNLLEVKRNISPGILSIEHEELI